MAAKSAGAGKPELDQVLSHLKAILAPYGKKLKVATDNKTGYSLLGKPSKKCPDGMYFAGARLGKSYVSFYLMAIYMNPGIMASMSTNLKRRMQGKACFNFKTVDAALFKELAALTREGLRVLPEGGMGVTSSR
jgi:hypothetical protein